MSSVHVRYFISWWASCSFFGLVSITVNSHAKFEVCIFSHAVDIRGSQNLKVDHVTQVTLLCDLILYFWISTLWSPVALQISTWLNLLFWRYCCCKILAYWLENAYSGLFLAVLGISTPYNCGIIVPENATVAETRILRYYSWKLVQQFGP